MVSGGEAQVDVVFANLPAEMALTFEERFAAQLRGVGDRVEARVAEKVVNDVLRDALEAGAEVVSVSPHRVSLETFFLSAVEDGAEEGNQ